MVEFGNKKLSYAAIGISGFAALIAATQGGGIVSAIGFFITALGAVAALLILKYGYILIPMFTSKSNIILITDEGYEIPPSQDAIVRKTSSGIYYASVFLGLRIYQSTIEMSQNELSAYNQNFERAMTNFKRVVKVAYMMHSIDITEKKKEYEEKRAEAQLRLQKEREKVEPDILKIQRYEKEISYYSAQIDRLIKGERPMRVVAYAMVTEVGVTKEEALSRAKAAASELKTLLSNSLNVDVDILQADEMLKIFDWEKFMPTTPEELEDKAEIGSRSRL